MTENIRIRTVTNVIAEEIVYELNLRGGTLKESEQNLIEEIITKYTITECKHRWFRTTKDYKKAKKCMDCGEIKQ